jgi:hypothetical protein
MLSRNPESMILIRISADRRRLLSLHLADVRCSCGDRSVPEVVLPTLVVAPLTMLTHLCHS